MSKPTDTLEAILAESKRLREQSETLTEVAKVLAEKIASLQVQSRVAIERLVELVESEKEKKVEG